MAAESVPRRLTIAVEFDLTSDELRRMHKSRIKPIADEAVEAAAEVVRRQLLDQTVSAAVRSRVQWGYTWVDEETRSTLGGTEEADESGAIGEAA